MHSECSHKILGIETPAISYQLHTIQQQYALCLTHSELNHHISSSMYGRRRTERCPLMFETSLYCSCRNSCLITIPDYITPGGLFLILNEYDTTMTLSQESSLPFPRNLRCWCFVLRVLGCYLRLRDLGLEHVYIHKSIVPPLGYDTLIQL